METPTPRPKPAPPKPRILPQDAGKNSEEIGRFREKINRPRPIEKKDSEQSNAIRHIDNMKSDSELPPLNLKSPNSDQVISVKDPEKAQALVKKGWTITTEKKTPYVRTEHLLDRPLRNNADLQALRDQLSVDEKPLKYKNNNVKKRSSKKRIYLKNKEKN